MATTSRNAEKAVRTGRGRNFDEMYGMPELRDIFAEREMATASWGGGFWGGDGGRRGAASGWNGNKGAAPAPDRKHRDAGGGGEVIIGRSSALFCRIRPVLPRRWWWKGADLFSRERAAGGGFVAGKRTRTRSHGGVDSLALAWRLRDKATEAADLAFDQ
ncbi:unnamed protein product [Calypogeia fissa]